MTSKDYINRVYFIAMVMDAVQKLCGDYPVEVCKELTEYINSGSIDVIRKSLSHDFQILTEQPEDVIDYEYLNQSRWFTNGVKQDSSIGILSNDDGAILVVGYSDISDTFEVIAPIHDKPPVDFFVLEPTEDLCGGVVTRRYISDQQYKHVTLLQRRDFTNER